jgi:hypothetical protein
VAAETDRNFAQTSSSWRRVASASSFQKPPYFVQSAAAAALAVVTIRRMKAYKNSASFPSSARLVIIHVQVAKTKGKGWRGGDDCINYYFHRGCGLGRHRINIISHRDVKETLSRHVKPRPLFVSLFLVTFHQL